MWYASLWTVLFLYRVFIQTWELGDEFEISVVLPNFNGHLQPDGVNLWYFI